MAQMVVANSSGSDAERMAPDRSARPALPLRPFALLALCLVFLLATVVIFEANTELVVSASLFVVVTFVILALSWRADLLLSWHFLIPLYYLVFMLAIPLLEQSAGLVDYTESRSVHVAFLLLTSGILIFAVCAWLSWLAIGRRSLTLTERKPLVFVYQWDVVVAAFLIAWPAKLYSVLQGYFGLSSLEAATAEPSSYAGILNVVSGATTIVLLVSWYQRFSGASDGKWNNLAWLSLLGELGVGLFATSKAALAMPIAYVLIVRYLVKREIKFTHVAALSAFLVIVVFPFVSVGRLLAVRFEGEGRLEYFLFLWNILVSGDWIEYLGTEQFADAAVHSLGRRLLYVFTTIISSTGTVVPYLGGQTYQTEFGILVPRFIWPDKPDMNLGNFFGHQYDLIAATDWITNIAPSQPGELYMNFGWGGVLLGMALWGVVASTLLWLFGARSWYTAFLVPAVGWQEASLTPLLLFPRNFLITILVVFAAYALAAVQRRFWQLLSSKPRVQVTGSRTSAT